VHNERCTPGSGRGRPETYRCKPARRRAPTSPESAMLAGKPDGPSEPALLASDAQKTMGKHATTEVGLEFVLHEGRQLAAFSPSTRVTVIAQPGSSTRSPSRGVKSTYCARPRNITARTWLRGQQEL